MLKKLIAVVVVAACLAAVAVSGQQTQPQPCPFSRERVEKLNFKPISACMFEPTAVAQTACDACICSFVDTTFPLWIEGNLIDCYATDFGTDSAVSNTFNNLMNQCAMTIGPKLSRDLGVSLFQLPRLFSGVQSCPTDVPAPMCLVRAMALVCPVDSPVMAALTGISAAPLMEM